jgi:hypothetical protein
LEPLSTKSLPLATFNEASAARALTRSRSTVGWLAALLIVAQLLLIAHGPHDARADDEPSTCVVCMLGHDLGSGLCHQTVSPPALLRCDPPLFYPAPLQFALAVAGYLARGPPSPA